MINYFIGGITGDEGPFIGICLLEGAEFEAIETKYYAFERIQFISSLYTTF